MIFYFVHIFQVPIDKVYLGPGVEHCLANIPLDNAGGNQTEDQMRAERARHIQTFRLRCLDYYVTAAKELTKYLPLKNEILREATFLEPKGALGIKKVREDILPDLSTLAQNFKVSFHTAPWREIA